MKLNKNLLTLAVVCAITSGMTAPPVRASSTQKNLAAGKSFDQSSDTNTGSRKKSRKAANASKAQQLKSVVVTGIRESMESASNRKRYANQIMDSIVAEQIGKLPDTNVADALQRVTGVQVTQDMGEGSTVAIRGLTEIETQLNGEAIFTASGGRTLNFEDIPAELLAGVDVYKTPMASQVEGGIGGVVNMRTHRPFDFKGLKIAASLGATHADLIGKTKPKFSGMISDIWNTSIGKVGGLLAISYQDRPFLEQYTGLTQPGTISGVVDANGNGTVNSNDVINYPQGEYFAYNYGARRRLGINGSLQWQPTDNLTLHLDSYLANFRSHGNTEATYLNTSFASGYSNITLFPGTHDFKSGTFYTVGDQPESFTKDIHDRTVQFAGGAEWDLDPLDLSANLSYTRGTHDQHFNEIALYGGLPSLSLNTGSTVPVLNYNGFNVTNPNNYTYSQTNYYRAHNLGKEKSGRMDASYDTGNDYLHTIKAGYRHSNRTATNQEINDVQYSTTSGTNYFGQPSSKLPGLMVNTRFSGLGTWTTPDPAKIRDAASIYKLFNIGSLPAYNPLSTYNLSEKTDAGYVEGLFSTYGSMPISGNIGVRFVRTHESVLGNQSIDGVISPLNKSSSYNDILPSLNLKIALTNQLQFRFAASKTITRPSFSDLTPSLTLTTIFHTGSAGNANLKPMKAKGADASLGWYFGKGNHLFGDVFYKNVKGFIAYSTNVEQFFGQANRITRPNNSNNGNLKGAEFSYQQFFTDLPGWMSGLGVQANYTYVKSSATGIIPGQSTPLANLSQNSYNLVLMYDRINYWARLAYNWRSRFLASTYYTNTSQEPIYMKSYGTLDASIGYKFSKHLTMTLAGVNLLRKHKSSYFLRTTLPDATYLEDRRVDATLHVYF
jgi:iron complex outermembrane receptor protein